MKMSVALHDLGVRQREREEDGVASRHVGDRDLVAADLVGRVVLRHLDIRGQRRATEHPKVDVADHVSRDPSRLSDALRRSEFDLVALPVAEAQGVRLEPLVLRDREHSGRVQAPAQQDDGLPRHVQHPLHSVDRACCPVLSKLHDRVAGTNA